MLARWAFLLILALLGLVLWLAASTLHKTRSCLLAVPRFSSSSVLAWGCQGSYLNLGLSCRYFAILTNLSLRCIDPSKLQLLPDATPRDLDSYLILNNGSLQLYFSHDTGYLVSPGAGILARCEVQALDNRTLLVSCKNLSKGLSMNLVLPRA